MPQAVPEIVPLLLLFNVVIVTLLFVLSLLMPK